MRPSAHLKCCLVAAAVIASLAGAIAPSPAAAEGAYSGRLDIRHTDDFAHSESSTRYTLRQGTAKRLSVRPTTPPSVPSGSRVVVRGKKRGSVVSGNVKARAGVRAAAAPLGEYKVAVLMVNFADDRSQPWTPAVVRNRFFTDSNSLDTFFKEQSWNQVDMTGEVYGWYQLPINGAGCNEDAYMAAADTAATAAGVPLGSFDSIAYVFPDQADCSWAGLAELPGNRLWLNGDISVRVASHELGHNMGVHHAAATSCSGGGVAVAISSTCTTSEYGDPFSTMGSTTRRMASWHLQQLGYTQPSNVQSVTTNGTYTLRTTLNQASEPQLLKIPRTPAGSPSEYYFVDLRSTGGVFDTYGIGDPVVNGVTIRIGYGPTVRRQSRLIDTTPDSRTNSAQDFLDAPLAPGRTFSDGTVSIRTTQVSGGVATVEVNWNGPTPDTQAPSAPAITAATHYGSYVDLGWSAATDDVGVTGYRVKRDGQTISTRSASDSTYRDYDVSPERDYTYCVEAFDAAGNSRSSPCTVPARYVPPTAAPDPTGSGSGTPQTPADVTRPAITVFSPGRNARLRTRATIRATATDAVGVEAVEFWVDGKRLATRRGNKLNLVWKLRHVKPGRHKVMVVAHDAAGNTVRRTVTVRVQPYTIR